MNSEFEFDSLIKKMAADHQLELPSAGQIWWRAQIMKKQAEKERIERPFKTMLLIAAVVSVVLVLGLWTGHSGEIRAIVGHAGVYSFPPFLFVGIAVVIIFIGLMWWTMSEA